MVREQVIKKLLRMNVELYKSKLDVMSFVGQYADQILAIEGLHEEAENQDIPKEWQVHDLCIWDLMLKGDNKTHWVKVKRHGNTMR